MSIPARHGGYDGRKEKKTKDIDLIISGEDVGTRFFGVIMDFHGMATIRKENEIRGIELWCRYKVTAPIECTDRYIVHRIEEDLINRGLAEYDPLYRNSIFLRWWSYETFPNLDPDEYWIQKK